MKNREVKKMKKFCDVAIRDKTVTIDLFAIAATAAGICQRYPECDGLIRFEAEQVFCAKCGRAQRCGDEIIKRTCPVRPKIEIPF